VSKYCLTLTSDRAHRTGNTNLIVINKYILEDLPSLKSKKSNNKFSFRFHNPNFNKYKYTQNLIFFIKKKFPIYERQLISILNKYHNLNENKKYWNKIIGSWLFDAINIIKLRLDDLLPFKKKKVFIVSLEKNKFNFFNNSFQFYVDASNQNYLNQFIYSRIAEILGINKKKICKKFRTLETPQENNNFFNFFFYLFYKIYIKIFRPIVLLVAYINFIDRLKIIYHSKGLIIFPKPCHLFKRNINTKIDYDFRSKIKIKEKDNFDKIFNVLLKYLIPISFLENFSQIKKNILNYSKNIRLVGSAMCYYSDDRYKILTAELLKKKKKPIVFDHGHTNKTILFDIKNEIEQKNVFEHICFSNKKGLGVSNLRRLNIGYQKNHSNKITLFTSKKTPFIVKTPDLSHLDREKKIKENIFFYNQLKEELKKNFILKNHPSQKDFEEKIWIRKFGKSLNINHGNSKDLMNYSKVIVISYFSTTVYEAFFLDKPTILYFDKSDYCFKKGFQNFINDCFDLKIAHKNSRDAANFLNEKYFSIEDWWLSNGVRKIMKIFKEKYCVNVKNFTNIFVDNYLKK